MSLVYNSNKFQYAVPQLLLIYSWGYYNFILRYSCFPLRSKWGGWEGWSRASVGDKKKQPPRCANEGLLKEIGNDLLFHRSGQYHQRGWA